MNDGDCTMFSEPFNQRVNILNVREKPLLDWSRINFFRQIKSCKIELTPPDEPSSLLMAGNKLEINCKTSSTNA